MKWLLVAVMLAGCAKKAASPDDAGWHPYKDVTPAKVKKQVEDINQRHEDQLDNQIDKARQE